MSLEATAQSRGAAAQTVLTVLRVTSGNFLEMLDFFLFGLFAGPIGDAFFPVQDESARLILALLTFGAGFLMRPLGALVLGAYIDRVGRRRGLVLTLGIMAFGTIVIAVTPSYQAIARVAPASALAAPLVVLLGRLAQGFSAGVELGGVSVYLAELAPPGRAGFFASWQSASQQLAVVVAGLMGFALEEALSQEAIAGWGWRLPFVFGCLIVPVLFVLRRDLTETDAFLARTQRPAPSEALIVLARNWRVVLNGMMLVVMTTVSFYLITIYAPTFGRKVLHLGPKAALLVTMAIGVSNFVWLPIAGAVSDRIGRKPVLLFFGILAVVSAYPVLAWLAASPSFAKMLIAELWLSFLYAGYNGAMVVALTEIVPQTVRTAGFSLAYSLAAGIFGGFTPAVSQELIKLTADKAAPGIWMTGAAIIGVVATLVVYRSEPKPESSAGPR